MPKLPWDESKERELVAGLRHHDEGSFGKLHELYAVPIYALAWRMLGDRGEAEDVCQDVFLQAYQKIGGFKAQSRISTWLYAIAKHKCLRRLQKRRRASFASLEKIVRTARVPDPADEFGEREKAAYVVQVKEGCLLGLLRCLALQQRLAFVMTVLLKLDVLETAEVLNKTTAATRTLVCRAKKNLGKFLCRNCSWFSATNPCRCENLIRFSLQKGWIQAQAQQGPTTQAVRAGAVEKEIQSLKKVIALYRSLPEPRLGRLQSRLRKTSLLLLSPKKVK